MNYKTAGAFRTALESRLLKQSKESGVPLVRLRKSIAFDRLLARLTAGPQQVWVLKGGFALQLRLEHAANIQPRTTRDVDLQTSVARDEVYRQLVQASRLDLGDWVQFEIVEPAPTDDGDEVQERGALRSHAQMFLDGRPFETFNVDIGLSGAAPDSVDMFPLPPLLEFAGIEPVQVPCYPLTRHIAEKLHAYVRPHVSGPSTRVKDLVDLLLIGQLETRLDSAELRGAIHATFGSRSATVPLEFPDPPSAWARPYRELARQVHLGQGALAEGTDAARRFLNPVLSGEARGVWRTQEWRWA